MHPRRARALRPTRSLSLAAALSLGLFDASASAQDVPPPPSSTIDADPPGYAAAIDGALGEFQAGRWAEARALFLRAHAVFPNARTLRGIGMASFEMGDYPATIEALEDSLASPIRPLTEEQRGQVESLLARAHALVGRFVVPRAPADMHLTVDGVRAEPEGWPASDAPIVLGVGTHTILMRDAEGRTARTRVVVRGGEADEPIDLVPPSAPVVAAPTDDIPWIITGIGGGLGAVGLLLYLVGDADLRSVENAVSGTEWSQIQEAYTRGPILTGAGITSIAIGVGAAAVGLVWALERELSRGPSTPSARVRLGVDGFHLEGAF